MSHTFKNFNLNYATIDVPDGFRIIFHEKKKKLIKGN